jgi:hypothetical protein
MFEWKRFFDQHNIEYRESGANVSRGNVAIHCPFCGPQDPGQHLSVNLNLRGYRCWRNPTQHRGKNPARLVQALLKIPFDRASQIVGNSVYVPSDFMAQVKRRIVPPAPIEAKPIALPKEFKRFDEYLPSGRPFRRYLNERGFLADEIERLTKRYGVYYAARGPYRGRVLFTVRHEGELISWTGRSIHADAKLRYKTLSVDPERAESEGMPPAKGAISHYLLWFDKLMSADADTLLLVEGPFDALKVATLGRDYGMIATCFFTAEPTEQQIELLHEACPQFKRRILLLDKGTLATGIRVASTLSSLGIVTKQIPKGLKDPGEFTPRTFEQFVLALKK